MKKSLLPLAVAAVLLSAVSVRAQVEYVDPSRGGRGFMLEPTRPTVSLPNSMVRVYPVRRDQLDDQIRSFPLTIISHRLGELFWLMPSDGSPGAWDRPEAYDQEVETPYYYSARFDSSLIQTEFAPTERCGHFRFTFPSGKPFVLLARRRGGDLYSGGKTISGKENITGEGERSPGTMQAFVYGEFSVPVTVQTSDSRNGKRLAISALDGKKVLEFRYGISFISVEQAKKNLQSQIPSWNFDKTKSSAKDRWNEVLGQINVEGGTPEQKRVFYASLYRSYERMVNITEDGQYYSSFDHKVHQDARPFYVDNWLWDTYRALEPLQTLLDPDVEADKIQSYVRMYQQSGVMPTFALVSGNYACMNGNHSAPWFADAWFKGIRNFDLQTAYDGVRKRSLDITLLPWRLEPKGPLDEFYAAHGYMPALRPGEKEPVPQVHPFEKRQPVPVTLENSFDDWNIAQLARVLKKPEDEKLFLHRAEN